MCVCAHVRVCEVVLQFGIDFKYPPQLLLRFSNWKPVKCCVRVSCARGFCCHRRWQPTTTTTKNNMPSRDGFNQKRTQLRAYATRSSSVANIRFLQPSSVLVFDVLCTEHVSDDFFLRESGNTSPLAAVTNSYPIEIQSHADSV